MRWIPFKFAIYSILIILSLVIVFHLLVLLGIVTYHIVWGGRIENYRQMLGFEIFSLMINLIIVGLVAMRGGYTRPFLSERYLRILFWILAIIFSLNTIGNLFSKNLLETIIFSPVTLILAFLFFRLDRKGFNNAKL